VDGDLLVAELRVSARPDWSTQAENSEVPLPSPSSVGSTGNEIYLDMPVSLDVLSEGLSRNLATLPASEDGYRVSRIELLGSAAGSQRWLVAITLAEDDSTTVAYGEASLAFEGTTVRLADLQMSDASESLLSAAGFAARTLAESLVRVVGCTLSESLEGRLIALRDALAQSVSPWPVSPLADIQSTLQAAYASKAGVVFRVRAQ
jgi:hypothetical protein